METMQRRYPLYAVLVLCLSAGRLLADPLFVPAKHDGRQLQNYPVTYDNRIICFTLSQSGGDKLFGVSISWTQYGDPHGLKTADLSLEVLDQSGKVIPTTLPAEQTDFTLVGSLRGGTAYVAYKIALDPTQVPTAVNVTWRGKQQHIVLNADSYLKL